MPPSALTNKLAPAIKARRPSAAARRLLATAVAAVATFAAIAAAIAPWLFSPAALMDAVGDQLQGSSGLYVAARGKTSFSLLPRPSIAVEGVAFADRNGALVIEFERASRRRRRSALVGGTAEGHGGTAYPAPRARRFRQNAGWRARRGRPSGRRKAGDARSGGGG